MSGYLRDASELALQFLERRYYCPLDNMGLHYTGSLICTGFFFSIDPHGSKLHYSKEGNWELRV